MRIVIRLLSFLNRYWKRVTLAYVCLFLSVAFSLGMPELVKQAIDRGVGYDPLTGATSGTTSLLIWLGIAILVVAALRGVFAFGQTYLGEYISQRVAYDIRNLFYDRVQRLSFAFHDTAQTGQLMSRATQDVEAVRFFISMGGLRILYVFITFAGICALLFIMNWRLALIGIACMPFIGYLATVVGTRLRPIWTAIQEGIAELGTILQENLSGAKVVKAFTQEKYESQKFERQATILYNDSIKASKIRAFNMPLMSFILVLASGIIIWVGGSEILAGRLTGGELIQFYLYLAMMAMPIRMMGMMVNMVSRGISAGTRIFEVLDAKSAVTEKPGAIELDGVQGLVRFQRVAFSYDSANPYEIMGPVLDDINLEAKPGEMVALLGMTGSGKSTLINLIPRFYDVTSGNITIDGTDIRNVTLNSLRSNIGIVQQDVFLFTATIADNIAYGAVDASMEDIIAASKAAQLHDFIDSLPDSYDTWVGERGLTLSGGQRQRLAIARTLLIDPRILIFDDSTSSVDTETEFLIQKALRELMKGRTTFVIAQRLQTVRDADQILVLDKGTIAERGSHTELLQNGNIYRQIYEIQLRDQEEALNRRYDES
ncbi:MAG: ABC transporter ATP-binding protein [Dehalococcoidales bacterium]|nr:MAG: ABC transporter ATP-binding protein [Dehalococcoidales bacterium]